MVADILYVVLEHVNTPTRRYYTKATWDPTSHLEVCREIDYEADETGPEAETEVIYRVPVERIREVLAASPVDVESVEQLLAWGLESSGNAAALCRSLSTLDPSVVAFTRFRVH